MNLIKLSVLILFYFQSIYCRLLRDTVNIGSVDSINIAGNCNYDNIFILGLCNLLFDFIFTQKLSIKEQINVGVNTFDLQIYGDKLSNEIKLKSNNLETGLKLKQVLNTIISYKKEDNPLLIFIHNNDNVNENITKNLIKILDNYKNAALIDLATTTEEEVKSNIIFFYNQIYISKNVSYLNFFYSYNDQTYINNYPIHIDDSNNVLFVNKFSQMYYNLITNNNTISDVYADVKSLFKSSIELYKNNTVDIVFYSKKSFGEPLLSSNLRYHNEVYCPKAFIIYIINVNENIVNKCTKYNNLSIPYNANDTNAYLKLSLAIAILIIILAITIPICMCLLKLLPLLKKIISGILQCFCSSCVLCTTGICRCFICKFKKQDDNA